MYKFFSIIFINIFVCTPIFIVGADGEYKSQTEPKLSAQPPLSRQSIRPPKTPPVINTEIISSPYNGINQTLRRSSTSSSPASTTSASSIPNTTAPGSNSLSRTSSAMGSPTYQGSRSISQTSSSKPSPTASMESTTPEGASKTLSRTSSSSLKNAFPLSQGEVSAVTTEAIMKISNILRQSGSQNNSPKIPRAPTPTAGMLSSSGEAASSENPKSPRIQLMENQIKLAMKKTAEANDTIAYLAAKNMNLEKELAALRLKATKETKDVGTQTEESDPLSIEDDFEV